MGKNKRTTTKVLFFLNFFLRNRYKYIIEENKFY